MAVSTTTKLFSTEDAKIRPLTADSESGTTYGADLDVPGIRQVALALEIESKQLRGDNRELDSDSILVAGTLTWEQAKLSYPVLAALIGGTWDGTTYERVATDFIPQFGMTWKTPAGGTDDVGGDVHFEVAKARVSAYTLGTAFEDYQIISGTARCLFRLSDDKLFRILPHESAQAISA